MENLKYILESLLFVADAPLTLDRLKKILIEAESKEIREALGELQEEYQQRQGGFDLRQVAGGYQFRSRNAYNEWITRLIEPSPVRLSKAALETLAIIAYKQPVIRSDVEHIRGVDCGGVLRVLLERQLVRVLGRKEIPGRPLIYATTKKFLEVFDLKDLKDLPSPKEIETFGQAINDGQVEVIDESLESETDSNDSLAESRDSADTYSESGESKDSLAEPDGSAADSYSESGADSVETGESKDSLAEPDGSYESIESGPDSNESGESLESNIDSNESLAEPGGSAADELGSSTPADGSEQSIESQVDAALEEEAPVAQEEAVEIASDEENAPQPEESDSEQDRSP